MKFLIRNGWPDVLLSDGQQVPAGATVREFATWEEVDAFKAAFEAALPPPPPPPLPVPESVPAWALSAVLEQRGKLSAVETAIAAYKGADAVRVRWIWKRGEEFYRNAPATSAIAKAIGYTEAQTDEAFREASTLANA